MTGWLYWLYAQAVEIQRDIYLAFAAKIKLYAETGEWTQLAIFLPMGILFGAVHAMTPGHSKTVLAAYLSATPGNLKNALTTAMVLSVVHVSMSIAIILLSLPLVSSVLGSAGRAPLLEDISRGLLGVIGLWMIWIGIRSRKVDWHERGIRSRAFGAFAGLIPCPLTLFVMTFAVTRGVTEAGLAFAFVMLIGVFLVLGSLAAAVTLARSSFEYLFIQHQNRLNGISATLQIIVGIILIIVAANEFR